MLWDKIKAMNNTDFLRRVGVKRSTFKAMVAVIEKFYRAKIKKKKKKRKSNKRMGGRRFTYGVQDRLLMTMMYWREYRTQFNIATDYGISEAVVCRTIQDIENILKKSKKFELLGKKKLSSTKFSYEVFVVDATETPIQRPKKNNRNIIQEKRSSTL